MVPKLSAFNLLFRISIIREKMCQCSKAINFDYASKLSQS